MSVASMPLPSTETLDDIGRDNSGCVESNPVSLRPKSLESEHLAYFDSLKDLPNQHQTDYRYNLPFF